MTYPQYLRIPGTVNHKPQYNQPRVEMVRRDFSPQSAPKITPAKKSRKPSKKIIRSTPLRDEPQALQKAINILRLHRSTLKVRAQELLRNLSPGQKHRVIPTVDRSVKIHQFIVALHQSGLSEDEILHVMWVEPHFRGKHGTQFEILVQEVERILSKLEGQS